MIRRLITRYGLAAHLALLASLPLALMPYLSASALGGLVLWLSAFAALWLFAEPSMRAGERLSQSRARVRRALARDPLFWFFAVALVFAAIRWANTGVALVYDAVKASWQVGEPASTAFPASAGEAGRLPFVVTVGAAVLVLGIRHGLGLAARLSFGLCASLLMGLGGLAAAACVCCGADALVARATADFLGGPFLGTVYGVWLLVAIASGAQASSRRWGASHLPLCVSVAGTAAGLLLFAPPALAAAYLLAALPLAVFGLVFVTRVASTGMAMRTFVMLLLGGALAALLLIGLAPEAVQAAKQQGLDVERILPEVYPQRAEALARISRAMWLSAPWCGVGVGAFGLHVQFLAERADWAVIPPEPATALSGYWTILAERGILGCALLLVGLGLLLFAWGQRLVGAVRCVRANDDGERFLFASPPVVWCLPLVLLLVGVEAAFVPVFALGPLALAVVAPLALAAASFPKKKSSPVSTSNES